MPSLSSYTPLESLLLFQALRADGVTSIPFTKISDQLRGIPLIRNDTTYDSARLSPDALKDLYLGLLKEEARRDVAQHATGRDNAQDGTVSPNSRKRRAPSPSLPTVEEAAKHAHLIPKLVYRLYASYREKIVAEIKEEERSYDRLTREIDEIERGEWDEKLRPEHTPTQTPTADATEPAEEKTPRAPEVPKSIDATRSDQQDVRDTTSDRVKTPSEQPSPSVARADPTKIDAVINHDPPTATPGASPQQSKLTTTKLPPLSEMAPDSPGPHIPLSQHAQAPQLPPPLQPGPAYSASPPMQQQAQFPPHYPLTAAQGPSPSPKLQNVLARASPSSPRPMLPLPPGMKYPPPSPVMQNGAQNHRPPPPMQPHQYPSPTAQRLPPVPLPPPGRDAPRQMQPHLPTPPGYPPNYPQYSAHQPTYPSPQQQQQQQQQQQPQQQQHQQQPQATYSPRPPQQGQGGIQLPPFQVSAQDPNRAHQQQMAQQAAAHQPRQAPTTPRQPAYPPYPPHPPYQTPQQQQLPLQPANVHLTNSIVALLKRSTPRSTWKASRPASFSTLQVSDSPVVEPLSPRKREASLPPSTAEPAIQQPRLRGAVKVQDEVPTQEDAIEAPPKASKSTRRSARQSRAGSVASSIVASSTRARTRSHSVVSHADSQHAPSEATSNARKVKDEPTTPADLLQQEILENSSDPPTAMKSTRPRRGTLQKDASSSIGKRKRQRSPTPADEEENDPIPTYMPPPNNIVQASRNFQRLSTVIMNDITTHRHAGPFQKPVREKDAEGYFDIIKWPQDLKSIKAAITAGSRAISAAAAKDTTDSPSATPSAGREGGTITLEKTADLIPPKAIVNSSQLEKEVMRMFANAVMFNSGDDGMVQDAREMADDIEAKVRDWRGAERQVEGRDDDDSSAAVATTTAKRRKL